MRLQIQEFIWEPEIVSEKVYASRHSGRQLSKTVIEFQAPREKPSSLEDAFSIAKTQGVTSIDDDGDAISNWKVSERSRSYSNNDRYETVRWEITEMEALRCEQLILGNDDLRVIPSSYSEDVRNEGIQIHAVAQMSKAEWEKCKEFRANVAEYFSVIRVGISDESLEMRFASFVWSSKADTYDVGISFVDRRSDETSSRAFNALSSFGQNFRQLRGEHIALAIQYRHLLDLLEEKEILSHGEIEQIIEYTPVEFEERRLRFNQVDDVMEWYRDSTV